MLKKRNVVVLCILSVVLFSLGVNAQSSSQKDKPGSFFLLPTMRLSYIGLVSHPQITQKFWAAIRPFGYNKSNINDGPNDNKEYDILAYNLNTSTPAKAFIIVRVKDFDNYRMSKRGKLKFKVRYLEQPDPGIYIFDWKPEYKNI